MFTRTPTNYINYSNQPASSGEPKWIPIPGASVNRTLPIGLSYADWHVHRLDWTKDRTVFFVDNTVVNTTTLNVPVITPPSKIYLDMWSSASDWTGSMQIGNNASFDIQWVELLFNSTDSTAKAATNKNVCIVDDIYPAPVESPTTQTGKNSQGVHLAALDGRLFGFWFSLFVYNVFFSWRV
jgi:beta-glucanase (GH16 family)